MVIKALIDGLVVVEEVVAAFLRVSQLAALVVGILWGVSIVSLETMSSFEKVLAILIAFISTGKLVKIVLFNGVGVDGDVDGAGGGEATEVQLPESFCKD